MMMKVGVVLKCGSCLKLSKCIHSTTVESVIVGFEPTSYTISEDGPLVGQVCVQINNLMGDLECNLVVNLNAISNNKSGMVV